MRVGRFKVPQRMLKSKQIDQKFYLQVLFTGLFILEATYLQSEDKVEYKAINKAFDDVVDGETVPEYSVEIDKKQNKAIFTRIIL